MTKELKKQATRLHTHKVVFVVEQDVECAARALLGQSTRAIAAATRLTEYQVQYRVSKAGIDRWAVRHEQTPLSHKLVEAGIGMTRDFVEYKIAPKFRHLAPK